MVEKPNEAILDREATANTVAEHLSQQTALLRDMANYGSNLVLRTFESSPRKWAEVVTCCVLAKQLTAMVDAAEVLLTAGCGHAAFLPARSAFEASLYLEWILAKNSEYRATCYIVGNYRSKRMWARRITPGTGDSAAFAVVAKELGVDVHRDRPNLAAETARELADLDRILAGAEMKSIDAKFDQQRRNKRFDPEWYEIDGATSIRAIAVQIKRVHEYDYFYSKGSKIAHTGSYDDHILFKSGELRLKPIRHVAEVNLLLNFLVSLTLRSFMTLVERYRPGEANALARKYLEDWRGPFMGAKTINYNF